MITSNEHVYIIMCEDTVNFRPNQPFLFHLFSFVVIDLLL